jgi:cytochrome c-type biogenesis protein CcmF
MIPELGHFALWLALAVSLVMGVVPIWGSVTGREDWMALSRPLAWLMFALIGVSYAASPQRSSATTFRCSTWHRTPTAVCP